MSTNGTAIEGVCVTGEAIRPDVPVASKERVPVARRYGAKNCAKQITSIDRVSNCEIKCLFCFLQSF
jgi:hypothetical protein